MGLLVMGLLKFEPLGGSIITAERPKAAEMGIRYGIFSANSAYSAVLNRIIVMQMPILERRIIWRILHGGRRLRKGSVG